MAVLFHYIKQKQQTKIRFYRLYLYFYKCEINLSRKDEKYMDIKHPNGDNPKKTMVTYLDKIHPFK